MSQDRGKDDTKKEEGVEKKCEKEDMQDKHEENKSSNMEETEKIEESDERYANEKKVKKDTDASQFDINGVPERKADDETNVKDETLEDLRKNGMKVNENEKEEEKVIKSEEKKDENCEDGKKNEVKIGEDDEYDKEDGKNVVNGEDKNGKIEESFSEIFINLEKTEEEIKEIKKTVWFEFEPEDMEMDKIQNLVRLGCDIAVGNILNTVFVVEQSGECSGEKIDQDYVNFPLSQANADAYFKEMEKNKTEKYVVDAKDISDVENGNERNVDNNKVTEQVERIETSENVSVENKSSEENDDLNVKTEGEREIKKAEKEGELESTEGDVKDENEIQKQNE